MDDHFERLSCLFVRQLWQEALVEFRQNRIVLAHWQVVDGGVDQQYEQIDDSVSVVPQVKECVNRLLYEFSVALRVHASKSFDHVIVDTNR